MSCLIHLVASACLLDTAAIEVRTDISRRFAGDFSYHAGERDFGGGNLFTGEISVTVNEGRALEWRYGVRHESLVDKRDTANRRVFVGVTWRPFR